MKTEMETAGGILLEEIREQNRQMAKLILERDHLQWLNRELLDRVKARLENCCEPDGSPDGKFAYCKACLADMAAIAKAEGKEGV